MRSEKNSGKPTPLPVFTRLTALFYLFFAVGLSWFSGRAGSGTAFQPDLVVVPEYVGMQIERAVSRMPNDRLSLGEINEVYSEAQPGIVVGQFPEPEMRVDPGTLVNLEVSRGPQPERRMEVPDVTGLNIRQAEAVLREAGLQAGNIAERASDEMDNGTVLEQSPREGTVVMENSEVDLVVSNRDFRVTVPDVISMQQEMAIHVLKDNRLNYDLYYENSGQSENMVLTQDPPPGSRVNEGTVVVLTLARQKQVSLWLFFVGILVVAISGGYAGYRLKKGNTKKSRLSGQGLDIAFKPVWEAGRQNVKLQGNKLVDSPLRFKIIQDSGSSSILIPGK
jgi:beta-lactam-binding protein with PASTA domain